MSLAKKKQNIIPKTTLDFIPFEDVWNNFIYLDNGKIIGGIKVKSINCQIVVNYLEIHDNSTIHKLYIIHVS